MARRVAKDEAILLGSSGGLAVAAALKLKDRLTPDDLVVVLIPDSGRGYLSRVYNDEWMASFGFTRECDQCVAAILDARSEELPPLLYVNPTHTVRETIDLMRANGVSQLPVCKNEPPFAAAEVSGAVDDRNRSIDAVPSSTLSSVSGAVVNEADVPAGGSSSHDAAGSSATV